MLARQSRGSGVRSMPDHFLNSAASNRPFPPPKETAPARGWRTETVKAGRILQNVCKVHPPDKHMKHHGAVQFRPLSLVIWVPSKWPILNLRQSGHRAKAAREAWQIRTSPSTWCPAATEFISQACDGALPEVLHTQKHCVRSLADLSDGIDAGCLERVPDPRRKVNVFDRG